jgi:CcmD family protein
MDNLGYLLAVFSIVWLGLFIYIFSLINKQNKLQKELKAVKELLKENGLGDR